MLGALAALPALPGLLDAAAAQAEAATPLASWNDGPAKEAILKFVHATTDPASPDFLPPEERIAEFDQDGTLWVEHPLYTQVVFCLDRVPALVKTKPELKGREPFKAVLTGDREAIAKLSMRELFEIVLETQSGMTVEDFRADVRQWLTTAKHPRWDRPYTDLVYQPMIELLALLRANGFANFIATGGSESFVREYSGRVYDIPPERVCGTAQAAKFGYAKDGKPILTQEPRLVLDNLEAGKIENFWLLYGRRPSSRLRQFVVRRSADARIREGGLRPAAFRRRAARRRRARIRLRSGARPAEHGGRDVQPGDVRHGRQTGLDRRQHEEGLEEDFRV